MNKNESFFSSIDKFIFSKLDVLKNDSFMVRINDSILALDEQKQKVISQIITFTFIFIPFAVAALFWFTNYQLKKEIEIKKQIVEQVEVMNSSNQTLATVSQDSVALTSIARQNDLENRIRNILSISGIDQQKVNVTDFSQASTSSSITKINATLNFSKFGTQDFSKFLRALIDRERFKIYDIEINRNQSNDLLDGTISVMHMGRSMLPQNENE